MESERTQPAKGEPGATFVVNVEGTELPWPKNTITTEELRDLAKWPESQEIIEVDAENNEHTLAKGEQVELKPGHGFGKKVRFKRGRLLEDRMAEELALLRTVYPEATQDGSWICVPAYALPPGWNQRV